MTTQYDFTKNEWDHVATTPVLVGLAIAKAEDSGFFGSIKEARTLVAEIASTADVDGPASQLIASAASTDTRTQANAFRATSAGALADAAVTACTELDELLGRVATPEEATGFKEWVLEVAQRVADAAAEDGVRVSPKEAVLLDRVRAAFGL